MFFLFLRFRNFFDVDLSFIFGGKLIIYFFSFVNINGKDNKVILEEENIWREFFYIIYYLRLKKLCNDNEVSGYNF